MQLALFSASAALLFSIGAPFAALADTAKAATIDPPEVAAPKTYSANGLNFDLPGNWTVTNNSAMDSGGGRLVNIEADKDGLEAIGLDASIQIFPDSTAPSLEDTADFLYKLQVEGSTSYSKPESATYKLGGRDPALAQRYTHNVFTKDRPYAHRLDLIARKTCGEGWVCLIFTQTLAVNEKAGSIGLAKIYETIRFAP
ncbi:hypothetical protein ASD89_12710 [Caulobacter sp. Root656]|nr:hypothetical protein ASD89_12710 [Caulobacter sp. Root656]